MENQIKRFFIVAGEPSGDLHGGKLIEAMKNIHPNILKVKFDHLNYIRRII